MEVLKELVTVEFMLMIEEVFGLQILIDYILK